MAGKQSAGMESAQKAITNGKATPVEAAQRFRLNVQSIYASKWYKAWRAAQKVAS